MHRQAMLDMSQRAYKLASPTFNSGGDITCGGGKIISNIRVRFPYHAFIEQIELAGRCQLLFWERAVYY